MTSDLKRLEQKLDLIIDAFGLSDKHRLAPAEVSEKEYIKPKKNKISMLRNTPHDNVIKKIILDNNNVKRGNFPYQLYKTFPEINYNDLKDELNDRRPDAFHICKNDLCNAVTIYEVEDTSRMSEEKLHDYTNLWDFIDQYDISIMLVIFNKYGGGKQYLNLKDQFYLEAQETC